MQVIETLTPAELQRRWQNLTEDEELVAFEGRAELDAYGEVALTPPPTLVHQRIANELGSQIQAQLGGSAIVECPVLVDGVLIADCAWLSGERAAAMTTPAAERPEIVVEVSSPRNTRRGLRAKAVRFLAHGVQEVILVELDGTIRFMSAAGESSASRFGLRLTLPPTATRFLEPGAPFGSRGEIPAPAGTRISVERAVADGGAHVVGNVLPAAAAQNALPARLKPARAASATASLTR